MPKRSTQRRRKNKESEPEKVPTPDAAVAVPEAPKGWHAVARSWYEALGKSGQSKFYEPSDWATAYLIAESLSRDLKPQVVGINEETGNPVRAAIPLKGASLSGYLKAMTALMVTEGDRRRAGVELQRGAAAAPDARSDVAELDDYRRRLAG